MQLMLETSDTTVAEHMITNSLRLLLRRTTGSPSRVQNQFQVGIPGFVFVKSNTVSQKEIICQ